MLNCKRIEFSLWMDPQKLLRIQCFRKVDSNNIYF
jgi:hypothetical protein